MALLEVLKAGKFYVPLNIHDPQLRRQQIFDNAGAAVLLCDTRNRKDAIQLAAGNRTDIAVETIDPSKRDSDPAIYIGPDDFAYILFTSGSTGPP